MGYGALFYRDVTLKVKFNFQWGFAVGETQTVGYSENMCVYGNYRFIVNY